MKEKILEIIKHNPNITNSKLAEKLNRHESTTSLYLKKYNLKVRDGRQTDVVSTRDKINDLLASTSKVFLSTDVVEKLGITMSDLHRYKKETNTTRILPKREYTACRIIEYLNNLGKPQKVSTVIKYFNITRTNFYQTYCYKYPSIFNHKNLIIKKNSNDAVEKLITTIISKEFSSMQNIAELMDYDISYISKLIKNNNLRSLYLKYKK